MCVLAGVLPFYIVPIGEESATTNYYYDVVYDDVALVALYCKLWHEPQIVYPEYYYGNSGHDAVHQETAHGQFVSWTEKHQRQ